MQMYESEKLRMINAAIMGALSNPGSAESVTDQYQVSLIVQAVIQGVQSGLSSAGVYVVSDPQPEVQYESQIPNVDWAKMPPDSNSA